MSLFFSTLKSKPTSNIVICAAFLLSAAFFAPTAHASLVVNRVPPERLNQGLVGYWSFDGSSITNNVRDLSGSGNTGYFRAVTATSTFLISGKNGQAPSFNGASYISVDNPSNSIKNLVSDFSLSFWAYPQSRTSMGYLGSDRWGVWQSGSTLTFTLPAVFDYVSSITLPFRKWSHVVIVFDSSHVANFYINGVLTSSVSGGGFPTTGTSFNIGTFNGQPTFKGSMDDARVYSRSLSNAEIKALYNMGTLTANRIEPVRLNDGLLGYWSFDGKTIINNVRDLSGQGNTGYLINAATSSQKVSGKVGQGLNFNGSNQYVALSSNLGLRSNFTISLWIKPSQIKTVGYITSSNNASGWILRGTAAGANTERITFTTYSITDYTVNLNIPRNVWSHVVAVMGATDVSFFLNGNFVSKFIGTFPAGISFGTGGRIGADPSSNWYSAGDLDEVRYYGRELSNAEVKALYNLGTETVNKTATNRINQGLVGHWTFDGKDVIGGRIADRGTANLPGYPRNIATTTFYAAGKLGQGASFDGINDRVSVPTSGRSDFTSKSVFFWLYSKKSGASNIEDAFEDGYWQSRCGDLARVNDRWFFKDTSCVLTQGPSLNLGATFSNKWIHIGYTWDGSFIQLYINGVPNGAAVAFSGPLSGSRDLSFGDNSAQGVPLLGMMDDIRVYNRALSVAEIKQLYNMGR